MTLPSSLLSINMRFNHLTPTHVKIQVKNLLHFPIQLSMNQQKMS